MLTRLIEKRNVILIVYVVISLVLWSLTMIFGNREDKILVLVLSLIVPALSYGLVRLMYKIVGINSSFKIMHFFFWFFLIMGIFSFVMMIVEYVGGFPNGLSPILGIWGVLIVATLDAAKKSIQTENKKQTDEGLDDEE